MSQLLIQSQPRGLYNIPSQHKPKYNSQTITGCNSTTFGLISVCQTMCLVTEPTCRPANPFTAPPIAVATATVANSPCYNMYISPYQQCISSSCGITSDTYPCLSSKTHRLTMYTVTSFVLHTRCHSTHIQTH